jgi:hypothetical protein
MATEMTQLRLDLGGVSLPPTDGRFWHPGLKRMQVVCGAGSLLALEE